LSFHDTQEQRRVLGEALIDRFDRATAEIDALRIDAARRRVGELRGEVDRLLKKRAKAPAADRPALQKELARLQGEVDRAQQELARRQKALDESWGGLVAAWKAAPEKVRKQAMTELQARAQVEMLLKAPGAARRQAEVGELAGALGLPAVPLTGK